MPSDTEDEIPPRAPHLSGPDTAEARLVATWVRAGRALEEIRRKELASLSDAEALAATEDLLSMLDALPPLPLRPSSGLVEQQRLFARAPRP